MKKILYTILIVFILAGNVYAQSQYKQNIYDERKNAMKYKKWSTKINEIEIIKIVDKRCNCYLIKKDSFYLLIDTSIDYEYRILLDHLNKLDVENLYCILLTYSHFDHVGNTKLLQEQYGSYVFIHSSEVEYINKGYTYLPKGTLPITKLFTSVIGKRITKFQQYQSCNNERIFSENMFYDIIPDIFNIQILHTPGHSSGSVSFIIDNEIAIVGDTMVNMASNIFPPFADLPELLPDSWKKLLDTNCRLFLPAHGKEIERNLLEIKYLKIVK
jgi:glyoxylase-like metal-dependent hydrolase (beta-lactamase superfamily II)